MGCIEIPDSPIIAEVEWKDTTDENFVVNVEVGGVVVMTRSYPRGWRPEHPYASDAEDAQEMALAEFGKALRRLIGETP